jgi:hypothetical protein
VNAPAPMTILDCLPADLRRELEELGVKGRGPFGRLQTQQIVNGHLDLIRRLRALGATHADLAALLAAVGITTQDRTALTAATLSSAISRAEAKAPKRQARHGADGSAAPARPASKAPPTSTPVPSGVSAIRASQPPKAQVAGAAPPETGATARTEAISPARRDHEIARDDPRAAIFALLDDSKEE